eukprot:2361339-Lingulodinium_polyedra.AAC.1
MAFSRGSFERRSPARTPPPTSKKRRAERKDSGTVGPHGSSKRTFRYSARSSTDLGHATPKFARRKERARSQSWHRLRS